MPFLLGEKILKVMLKVDQGSNVLINDEIFKHKFLQYIEYSMHGDLKQSINMLYIKLRCRDRPKQIIITRPYWMKESQPPKKFLE